MKIQQSMVATRHAVSATATGIPSTQKSHNSSRGIADRASATFSDMVLGSVEKVNSLQKQADVATDALTLGDNKDIVQTMILMEKADVSFRLMVQIRNKIIQAYEETMRMQV